MINKNYKIKSLNQNSWWKDRSIGFTKNIEEAGNYSFKYARENCRDANTNGKINLICIKSDNVDLNKVPTEQQEKRPIKQVISEIKSDLKDNKNPLDLIIKKLEEDHYYLDKDHDSLYFGNRELTEEHSKIDLKIHVEFNDVFAKNKKNLYINLDIKKRIDGSYKTKIDYNYGLNNKNKLKKKI